METYETGRVTDVQPKQTKDGTSYLSLRIDGRHFTCWDEDLFSDLEEGIDLEYRWKPSGRFRRITEFRRRTEATGSFSSSDHRITRMNALRTAAMLYANYSSQGSDRDLDTLSTAMMFELYLLDEEPFRTIARDYKSRFAASCSEAVHRPSSPGGDDAGQAPPDSSPAQTLQSNLVDRILSDELDKLSRWLYE